jgi:M6 family metalloprotease-like protein
MTGDEYFNYYHTIDGYFIIQGKDGFYYYADQPQKEIITTNYKVNSVNPKDLNLKTWLIPNKEEIAARIKANTPIKPKNDNNNFLAKRKGLLNNIVIFIKFAGDTEYTDKISDYDSLYNDEKNISFRHYYQEASFNNLDVVTHFYPSTNKTVISITDKNERNYYTPYNETVNPKGYKDWGQKHQREEQLLSNALSKALQYIPQNIDFDLDNDGSVDNVNFIAKGGPTAWSSLLWPHRAWFGGDIQINGLNVHDYNFNLSELSFDGSYGLGTICHEFFHTLGSPDLYHYSYDGKVPVGGWDLMGQNSNPPQLMSNFLKWQYTGWIEKIPVISKEGKYELNPISSPEGSIYKILSKNFEDEYFILEYRRKEGNYDKMIPGSGLLVYRIDNSIPNQGNGGGPPDEIYLYRPNGNSQDEGSTGNANFCKEVNRTSIGDYTNPQLFHTNGQNAGFEIFNISNCGDIITFEISYKPRTVIIQPEVASIDQQLLPLFKWRKIPLANTYTFELSTDYDFKNKVVSFASITDTVFQMQNELKKGTFYYARVKWFGNGNESGWSDVVPFSTIQDKTILISPVDKSNELSIMPVFVWKNNINNNYYRIQISDTPDFNKTVFSKTFIKDTSIQISTPLKLNTKYYWKIRSQSLTGLTIESAVFTFETKQKEMIITDISKSNDICPGDSVNLKISIAGTKPSYKWIFNDEEIPNSNDSILVISDFQIQNIGKYTCIAYNDEFDISIQSPEIYLASAKMNNFENIPQIVNSRTDSNIKLTVILEKKYQDFSNSYKLQWFKNDIELNEGNKYKGTKSLTLTILTGDSTDNDTNYKLRLISKCGDTLYSNPYSVTVSVQYYAKNTGSIILHPNPASDYIEIQVKPSEGLEPSEGYNVQIFNTLGIEVSSAGGGRREVDGGGCRIDISNLPTGIYFIKIGDRVEKFVKMLNN